MVSLRCISGTGSEFYIKKRSEILFRNRYVIAHSANKTNGKVPYEGGKGEHYE